MNYFEDHSDLTQRYPEGFNPPAEINEDAEVSYELSAYEHQLDLEPEYVHPKVSNTDDLQDGLKIIRSRPELTYFALFVYVNGGEVYSKETDDIDVIEICLGQAETEVNDALTIGRINGYDI